MAATRASCTNAPPIRPAVSTSRSWCQYPSLSPMTTTDGDSNQASIYVSFMGTARGAYFLSVQQRIPRPGFREAFRPQPAAVADGARPPIRARIVAAVRETVVDTQVGPESDNLPLR